MNAKSKYYKHPAYGFVKGEEFATPKGRFVWPHLVTPKEGMPAAEGQPQAKPRYEVSLLLDKADPEVKSFIDKVTIMTDEMLVLYNQNKPTTLGLKEMRLKDGDDAKFDKEKYPYYKGMWVLIAKNENVTPVYSATKEQVEATQVKGGMIGKLVIVPVITGWGVSFQLRGAQIIKDDGTKYGGELREASSFLDVISEDGAEVDSTDAVETPPPAEVLPEPTDMRKNIAGKKGQSGVKAALDKL